jgi:endogenous inhibitor of DNA gyrase (YacG/DUF329 family)
MAEQKCPNCGRDLPKELGQHSVAPMSGLVTCPHCGADVHLERATVVTNPGSDQPAFTGDESSERFSGSETMQGVKEEIEEKDQRRLTDDPGVE